MFEEHGYSTLHPWYLSQGLITNSEDKISLGNGSFQCCICGLNCSSDTNFLIHKISSHSSNNKEYDCDYCFEKYPSKSNLRLHVLIGHGSYKYQCPVCSLTFDESVEFCEHVDNEHIMNKFDHQTESCSSEKKKVLTCDLCLLNVRGPRTLSKHMHSIHGITLDFDCKKCGKLFETQEILDTHIASIHGGNPNPKDFICEKCSRMFSSNHLLITHMRCHSNGKKITCKTCGKTFKWQSSLVRHTRSVHSNTTVSVQYGCKFCGKSFKDQSSLKYHVFTHTGDKPFKCDSCGKGFVRKSLMMTHLATCSK
uniref:Zinc finger protein 699 [Ailuropoda melanoleuca] n=1 Tax=Lepeophtheirus salmonis TaxID=72036 RepID=A0A0K2TAF1_LEPSM